MDIFCHFKFCHNRKNGFRSYSLTIHIESVETITLYCFFLPLERFFRGKTLKKSLSTFTSQHFREDLVHKMYSWYNLLTLLSTLNGIRFISSFRQTEWANRVLTTQIPTVQQIDVKKGNYTYRNSFILKANFASVLGCAMLDYNAQEGRTGGGPVIEASLYNVCSFCHL